MKTRVSLKVTFVLKCLRCKSVDEDYKVSLIILPRFKGNSNANAILK